MDRLCPVESFDKSFCRSCRLATPMRYCPLLAALVTTTVFPDALTVSPFSKYAAAFGQLNYSP